MILRQPGIMALSVAGNVEEKVEFFVGEIGLSKIQVAKMITRHPQVSTLTSTSNTQCTKSKHRCSVISIP